MPRNKYPEETVRLILDVATRLFAEKGYDRTSLQDIINAIIAAVELSNRYITDRLRLRRIYWKPFSTVLEKKIRQYWQK